MNAVITDDERQQRARERGVEDQLAALDDRLDALRAATLETK